MARFLNGLSPYVAQKIEIQAYFTLDDVCKLILKLEKLKKEKKIITKPFDEGSLSSRAPHKFSITPKPKSSPKVDKAKALALPLLKSFLRNLKARYALNAKGVETSDMIALIKGSWTSKR